MSILKIYMYFTSKVIKKYTSDKCRLKSDYTHSSTQTLLYFLKEKGKVWVREWTISRIYIHGWIYTVKVPNLNEAHSLLGINFLFHMNLI